MLKQHKKSDEIKRFLLSLWIIYARYQKYQRTSITMLFGLGVVSDSFAGISCFCKAVLTRHLIAHTEKSVAGSCWSYEHENTVIF